MQAFPKYVWWRLRYMCRMYTLCAINSGVESSALDRDGDGIPSTLWPRRLLIITISLTLGEHGAASVKSFVFNIIRLSCCSTCRVKKRSQPTSTELRESAGVVKRSPNHITDYCEPRNGHCTTATTPAAKAHASRTRGHNRWTILRVNTSNEVTACCHEGAYQT